SAGVGSYTLTYTVTQLGINYSDQVTASVNALPVVTMDPIPSLCVGASAITLSGGSSSSVGTGVYTVDGATASSFDPTTAGSFNITYTFTDANGCSASASTSLVVNAPDAVSISASNDTISVGGSVTLTATNITGATYSWSDGSASVGSGQIIVASPATTTTYTVSVTNTATGCISTASKTITVLAAPSVDAGGDLSACVNGNAVTLGGSPSGGTWSGTGVTNNAGVYSFSPSSAGVGSYTLTYTVTQLGINYSDQVTASVNALPVVTMDPIPSLCVGATAITLSGGSSSSVGTGVYTVGGLTASTFNPTTAGSFNVTYTFTDANGCSASASTSLVVNAPDAVSISASNDTISVGGSVTLTATNIAGASYSWSDGSASAGSGQIIVASPTSNTNYSVSVTNPATGCISTDSITITVLAAPSVNAGNDTAICQGSANLSLSGSPSGGTWSGPFITGDSFNPINPGTYELVYSYEQLNVDYFDTLFVTVLENPTVFT
ncbi:MAG: hypothetical protein ACKOAV_08230, partial [Bacteroidota bacterium]